MVKDAGFNRTALSRPACVGALENMQRHLRIAVSAAVQDNSFRYWTAFVAEYFADGAVMRLAVPSAHSQASHVPSAAARQSSYGALAFRREPTCH